jgi:glyoxylate reductase
MSTQPVAVISMPLEDEFKQRIDSAVDARHIPVSARQDDVIPHIAEADGVLVSNMLKADARLFDAAPKLRVLSGVGVGYDNADVAEATRRGIAICNTPGVLTGSVADLTIASITMLPKRLLEHVEYVRSGAWSRREPAPPLGHDIHDKLLGVVGFGRIGREVTRRAQALGMRTAFYDLFDTVPEGAPQSDYLPLDELLRASDFVSMHVDLNETSRHMISTEQLALMKPTAYIINTSRGPVIDEAALTDALKAGQIAGAALDVFEVEPVPEDAEIYQLPNVIPFNHMATATEETRMAMRGLAVDNMLAVLRGEMPPAIVNPEVLQAAK